jgi:mersacidin/lichenicidin family type 2 lantibiotic
MSNIDVIRAWKDEEYRLGLSETERKLLPAHPAGAVEISNDDLQAVNGAFRPSIALCSEIICTIIVVRC